MQYNQLKIATLAIFERKISSIASFAVGFCVHVRFRVCHCIENLNHKIIEMKWIHINLLLSPVGAAVVERVCVCVWVFEMKHMARPISSENISLEIHFWWTEIGWQNSGELRPECFRKWMRFMGKAIQWISRIISSFNPNWCRQTLLNTNSGN